MRRLCGFVSYAAALVLLAPAAFADAASHVSKVPEPALAYVLGGFLVVVVAGSLGRRQAP